MATYFVKSNGVTVDVCERKGDAVIAFMETRAPKQIVEIDGTAHRVIAATLWDRPKH